MNERCTCGCCHIPDHGACDTFERGMNGRCVYCDHGEECHPGTGPYYNTPLSLGNRIAGLRATCQKEKPFDADSGDCHRCSQYDTCLTGYEEAFNRL